MNPSTNYTVTENKPIKVWAITLCAIALAGWAGLHFITCKVIVGRPPIWPEGLWGEYLLAYIFGILLLLADFALLVQRYVKFFLALSGLGVLLWAATRNLYQLVSTMDFGIALVHTNKAISTGFGLLFLAHIAKDKTKGIGFIKEVTKPTFLLTNIFIGLFFLISGVQHFFYVDFIKILIPSWIPFSTFWVYVSGVFLLAGGLSLLTGIQRKRGALLSGWMILSWVFLVHLPRVIRAVSDLNEWTSLFEASFVSGILFLMATVVGEG